ncbi:hypothetical protein BH09BAC5_BH09BAC5_19680 [soil metagenome]
MKKIILLFSCIFLCAFSFAQNPSYQQKLYSTCKVWGFVKYYHSAVSSCQVNWDSVLVAALPLVKNSVTQNDFNDALDTLLNAAGPMAIATTNPPPILSPELRRNLNFTWINDTILRSDVKVILDTIKNNFRPNNICWVENNNYTNSYQGFLVYPFDSLMLDSDTYVNFPNEWNRLLVMFKHWNIINYFNPYNYVLDSPIDSILFNNVLPIANAPDPQSFFFAFKKIAASLNDIHVEVLTGSTHSPSNVFSPLLILKYTQNKYVAVKSLISNISRGDEIVSIDGLTTTQWEDSLRPYISAGDSAVFGRTMCGYLLYGSFNSPLTIVSKDSLGNNHTISTVRSSSIGSSWFTNYNGNDTLSNVRWRKWGCNVGYVNMGKLQNSDVNAMYSALQNTSAIIFDIRNYPNGTAYAIANLMYPQQMQFAKDLVPDVNYPGTYYWYNAFLGYNNNTNAYQGKVIVLMNEATQSQAEYSCMIFDAMPNSVNVGSQTAGADGDVSYFRLSPDIQTGFSNLGVYYPNNDSTQRIGIVPDSTVHPTQIGIRHHQDEVLEKALEISQCWLNIDTPSFDNSGLSIYPNPTDNIVNINIDNIQSEKIEIEIMDMTGRIVFRFEEENDNDVFFTSIDMSSLPCGLYFFQLKTEKRFYSKKLIKL